MPGKVKVKILAGRNLPVMDRSSDTTDAYVEVKLGTTTFKTDVCRKSLNPQWNTEWYRFEVDDSELQDEPLQIRLMDHDTYSANDAIGKVYLDLNPLLLPDTAAIKSSSNRTSETGPTSSSSGGNVMSGWIPVYDTMHGIRGEVNVIVKVELFSDFNKFRQSSCGVQFFCSGTIPQGYHAQVIHGFVEELVVNDDPEYQWIDKIRTPRASNEARQTLFFKLSGEVQRKIGLKALDLGGNAVIGYYQCFDLEGESGIVVRGIGTAVTLIKLQEVVLPVEPIKAEDMLSFVLESSQSSVTTSPRLRVIPPTSPSSTFPPPDDKSRQPQIETPRMGLRFPGVGVLKSKNKKKPGVVVIPSSLAAGSGQNGHNPSQSPDMAKYADYKSRNGRSTQSLSNTVSSDEAQALRDLIEQEDLNAQLKGNPFSRGLKAIGSVLRAKLSPGVSVNEDETESDTSCKSEASRPRSSSMAIKKARFKLIRRHKRSSSDSMATTLVLSLMGNTNLDRVVEVRESPNSSPSSPPRGENFAGDARPHSSNQFQPVSAGDYLMVPSLDPAPDLTYVDGHLISTASSGVSSSSDSSSSEDEGSEEYILETKRSSRSPSPSPKVKRKPKTTDVPDISNNLTPRKGEDLYMDQIDLVKQPKSEKESNINETIQANVPKQGQEETKTSTIKTVPIIYIAADEVPIVLANQNMSDTTSLAPSFDVSDSSSSDAPNSTDNDCNVSVEPFLMYNNPNVKIDLSVPTSACLIVPTLSPLHKSKSAVELPHASTNIDPSDQHGPCLLPSNRPITELELEDDAHESSALLPSAATSAPKSAALPAIHRRSSDSDLSITPKGNSLTGTGSDRSSMGTHLRPTQPMVRPSMNQETLDMLEYPFLTMTAYPPGFILHLGGCVSSRSVKLLERITNLDEPESRDIWWTELRMEVRSHARALGCNVVLGYSEHTSICDDVCVLSASGTAAVIGLTGEAGTGHAPPRSHLGLQHKELMTTSLDRTDFERDKQGKPPDAQAPTASAKEERRGQHHVHSSPGTKVRPPSCDLPEPDPTACQTCHIPYSETSVPYRVTMITCAVCKRGKVPDVLFTTIELLEGIPTIGKGCFVQAYTVKAKRDSHGELNATEISDGLPFLEYELHRLLVNKLKMKGMNAIFKLKVQVAIGEKLLVGLATGTAVFLAALPTPPVPKVTAGKSWTDAKKLADMQKLIQDTIKANRELYQLNRAVAMDIELPVALPANGKVSEGEESEDELADLDLSAGNKDTCVLEVDDAEDVEVVSLLLDPAPPQGFHVVSTETVPGLMDHEVVRNLQMFTQVWRAKIPLSQNQQGQCQNPLPNSYSHHFQGMLQSVFFKLRRMSPCALCDLQFKVMLSEADEMQLSVYGMALGLGEPERPGSRHKKRIPMKKVDDSDTLMFSLEEDQAVENPATFKLRPYSPFRARTYSNSLPHHTAPSERYGVDLTPLSYVPGGKIERYLGNLNFFFIRESTSVREGGGLSGFIHSFLTEVLAIVRAHVTALGGNAMVAYFVSECVLYHNQHKNQGQCLINVGGDVVYVSYKG